MILTAGILRAHFLPYSGALPTTLPGWQWPILQKSIIRTPRGSDGKVDYDSVPVGASIWVSVTDPTSPLHGRPILITKRPDKHFALTGGSGWAKYKPDAPSSDAENQSIERLRARKHEVLQGVGQKKATKADLEESAELQAQRAKLTEAQQERRTQRSAASTRLMAASGYDETLKHTKQELEQWEARTLDDAKQAGLSPRDARLLTNLATSEIHRQQRKLAQHKAELRALAAIKAAREGHDDAGVTADTQAALDALPEPGDLKAENILTPEQIRQLAQGLVTPEDLELKINTVVDQAAQDLMTQTAQNGGPLPESATGGPTGAPTEPPGAPGSTEQGLPGQGDGGETGPTQSSDETKPAVTTGPPEPPPLPPEDPAEKAARVAKFKELIGAYQQFQQANKTAAQLRGEVASKRQAITQHALVVDTLREQVVPDISDDELQALINEYTHPENNLAPDAFYQALGTQWNDAVPYAAGIGPYANAGGASAITALVGKYIGSNLDVGRLIDNSTIEAAATAVAVKLRHDLSDEVYDAMVRSIQHENAVGLEATEKTALALHTKLVAEREEIIRQRSSGELNGIGDGMQAFDALSDEQISPQAMAQFSSGYRLEADNLMRQRENLGTALGSMSASATLLDAFGKAKKGDTHVTLSFGEDPVAAQEQSRVLGMGAQGAVHYRFGTGYQLTLPATKMHRFISEMHQSARYNATLEAIKTNPAPTAGYAVPGWRATFTGDDGTEQPYAWRTEQRNDIEWLKRTGGGVISRVTGAGKTNTTLGYFANKLAENPDYTPLVVVPKGKASEWQSEAQRYSTLPTLLIPDDMKRPEVAEALARAPRGVVIMMSHDQASRNAEVLHAMDLSGVAIDEPQVLIGRGKSKNYSAGARRIMTLGQEKLRAGGEFNRIAMTATPAVDDPVNAYDLVNWVAPGKVGHRTWFRRAYSGGFGAGTNAQQQAISEQVLRHLGPYLSGERLTASPFKVLQHEHLVSRSEAQRTQQAAIEAGAADYIAGEVKARIARAANDPLIQAKYGKMWRSKVTRDATVKAQQGVLAQHRANLGGGADNPKIQAALAEVKAAGANAATKHVFFVDSAAQRQALVAGLIGMGYHQNQIANIAPTAGSVSGVEIGTRRERFKHDEDVPFILIDKTTAVGHNLQEGSHLHVLGTPADAATYLQAQGRIARGDKTSDVHIHTYKYTDSPFESADWSRIDRQIKVLRATAPGLVGNA